MSSDLPRTVHQMASYAAYHLSEQATGGHQWTEEQVEANLRQIYANASDEDIAAALHYGRESVHAAEAFRDNPEETTLSEATGVPEDMPVTVYFRLRWGEGRDAEYRIFGVQALAGTDLATLGEIAEEQAAELAGENDYQEGPATEVQLFKVDFFND